MISIFLMYAQNNVAHAQDHIQDEEKSSNTQHSTLEMLYRDLEHARANDYSKIVRLITQEWEKSGSATLDFLYDTAQQTAEHGELTLAIDQITAALEHGPDFTQAYVLRATLYIASGSYGPAISDLQAALSLDTRHFEAIILLAQVLEDTGREAGAKDLYEQVITLAPHHPVARARIGHLLYLKKGWPIAFMQDTIGSAPIASNP